MSDPRFEALLAKFSELRQSVEVLVRQRDQARAAVVEAERIVAAVRLENQHLRAALASARQSEQSDAIRAVFAAAEAICTIAAARSSERVYSPDGGL